MTLIHDHLIKSFRDYLQQLGYSKSSVRMLPDCVEAFLERQRYIQIDEVISTDIVRFYEWLQVRPNKLFGGGLSEQYINHHIYALKVFFSWLEVTGQIRKNPISVLKFKSPASNRREPFTKAEIKALFNACTTLKEAALLHLFYSCGLRRTEGVYLNTRDIHFKQQILYVREGKGTKRRAVPITYKVSKDLESYYLEERDQPNVRDPNAFMLDRVGRRMSGSSYNRRLKWIAARVPMEREISLHYLRHSIATHLLESGLPVENVRDFLGHSHLEATQIYAKVYQKQIRKL